MPIQRLRKSRKDYVDKFTRLRIYSKHYEYFKSELYPPQSRNPRHIIHCYYQVFNHGAFMIPL